MGLISRLPIGLPSIGDLNPVNWLTEWVGDTVYEGLREWIYSFFYDACYQLFSTILNFLGNYFFAYEGYSSVDIFSKVWSVCAGVASGLMVVIVLFNIIQNLFDVGNGEQPTPIITIVGRTVKASIMIAAMPWGVKIILSKMVYPFAKYIFGQMSTDLSQAGASYGYALVYGKKEDQPPNAVISLYMLFMAIAVTVFLFKMCIIHVDLMFLQMFSIVAAISLCTERRELYEIWWKTFLQQVITLIAQVMLIAAASCAIVGNQSIIIVFGCLWLVIKEPAVLKNFWFSSGAKKSLAGGAATIARMVITKGL